MVLPLLVLDGDVVEPEVVPLELDELAPDAPVDEPADVSGVELLVAPEGEPLVLLASFVDGLLLDGLLLDGLERFTSPVEVLVTPLRCALPVEGTQLVELTLPAVEAVVPEDIPALALMPLVLVVALAAVLSVVPVPFAPFVRFRPVKR